MKRLYLSAMVLTGAIMIACSSHKTSESEASGLDPRLLQEDPALSVSTKDTTAPAIDLGTPVPSSETQTQTQNQTASGLNPAHGQPGHRCDIPVGSPLNSPPMQVKAGMNPPHGQPGHRCDIPIGAPLNSPPGKTNVAHNASQQAANQGNQQQVNIQSPTTTKKTAPGMNPPHGQPGHRCDIAVGAPLNSKPVRMPEAATNPPAKPDQESSKPADPPKPQ